MYTHRQTKIMKTYYHYSKIRIYYSKLHKPNSNTRRLIKITKTFKKSKHFDEFLNSNNLTINNSGKPTWSARGPQSITDYTLTKTYKSTTGKF